MTDLRENVARIISPVAWKSETTEAGLRALVELDKRKSLDKADAAIAAVIEALAAEADGQFHAAFMFNGSDTMTGLWMEVSDWLRDHLPSDPTTT